MKYLGIILILGLLVTSCSGSRKSTEQKSPNGKKETVELKKSNDKEEYKVVVLDPGFESWYETHWSPATDRSESYYHSWNVQYVTAWNYKATHAGYANFFTSTINYNINKNYGLKVERKLYYYFRWVETQLHIPILNY